MVELLAPVGNFEMLAAALNAGADSVYFGVSSLNMRAGARNFTVNELSDVVKKCHSSDTRAYLCVNTIIYEDELKDVEELLLAAKKAEVDAIICWDMSVISAAKKLGFEIHLSTQASVSNSKAAKSYDVDRIVLARECTLDDIKKIKKSVNIKIEAFIHGAMCVSESGRCFVSEELYGKSANRGECIQPCRRKYIITDSETGKELELDSNYVMSPKDLCTIEFIDKLIETGIDCFKIEGRNRSPEYVKVTVECYKEAIALHEKGELTDIKKKELKKKLATVYNRGFSDGFYMNRPIADWTDSGGSKATVQKEYLGFVVNYFDNAGAAEIKLESGELLMGDKVLIIGPTTGCMESSIDSMEVENKKVDSVKKGDSVGVKLPKCRKNDKVYKLKHRKV